MGVCHSAKLQIRDSKRVNKQSAVPNFTGDTDVSFSRSVLMFFCSVLFLFFLTQKVWWFCSVTVCFVFIFEGRTSFPPVLLQVGGAFLLGGVVNCDGHSSSLPITELEMLTSYCMSCTCLLPLCLLGACNAIPFRQRLLGFMFLHYKHRSFLYIYKFSACPLCFIVKNSW